MKSENVVLTVCVAMIIVFVCGLTIQSCKSSSSLERKSTLKVDSTGEQRSSSVVDLDSFVHKLQVDEFNYEWNIETYVPTTDSAGHVTGSAILSRNTGKKSSGKKSSETAEVKKKDSVLSESASQIKKKSADSTDVRKESSTKFDVPFLFIAVLLLIIGFVYVRIRHPTLWVRVKDFFSSLFKS